MLNAYTIVKEIAKTGHFLVFEATRNRDGKRVALKVLTDTNNADALKRFQNEARLLKSFDHPNIIKILDQDLTGRNPWIATPLYRGNLAAYVQTLPPDAIDEKLEVFEHVMDAVAHAHLQSIWHRDIKCENILLNDPSDVVLIDFNIALCEPFGDTRITQDGTPMGTPFLMAPEQLTTPSKADSRTDVFLLGALLYRILGGSLGGAVLDLDPIPARYRAFIQRATEPRPVDRYPDASEMKRVWHLLYDSAQQQSERNEIGILATDPAISLAQLQRLVSLLQQYESDDDVINDFFMQCDEDVLTFAVSSNPSGLQSVLTSWLQFILSQQWPWEHTDKVAARCVKICKATDLPEVKSGVIVTMLKLAYAHHRFRVWREAAAMLVAYPRDPFSIDVAVGLFAAQLSVEECEKASEYIDPRTPSEIRRSLTPLRRAA